MKCEEYGGVGVLWGKKQIGGGIKYLSGVF